MKNTTTIKPVKLSELLKVFHKVQQFNGNPQGFWKLYLETLAKLTRAKSAVIALQPAGKTMFQPVVFWPDKSPNSSDIKRLLNVLEDGQFSLPEKTVTPLIDGVLAIRLNINSSNEHSIALLECDEFAFSEMDEMLQILDYLHNFPAYYQMRKGAGDSLRVNQFAGILDLLVLINDKDRFVSAAMTFCNEVAARHHCDRVSIGWLKGKYIRLQAISHSDDYHKKMDAVKKLELAMEEAFEQNVEIALPIDKNKTTIVHDHEQFAKSQDVQYICSIPMRLKDEPVAVCTLERNTTPFSIEEQKLLFLTCDQTVKRLHDLKNNDKWIGSLLISKFKKAVGRLVGFNHTGAKCIGILSALALGCLLFIPVTYRLEAPVIVRTDSVAFLTAPYNSHIDNVASRVGDEVKKNEVLLELDKNELLLEEARLQAEKNRYRWESEKARASDDLAEMRIAEALMNQAMAQLELVQYQLKQVSIAAPFDGVIVEGDQMERVGAPVQQGDVLYKIARIENMYAEIEVPETEIHSIKNGMKGEIALASKPQHTFGIDIFRIEPAAVVKDDGNVFVVHGSFSQEIPQWWRPGMTGIAKLHADKKNLMWIFTHRTIDFIRLKIWW